ncbi:sigma-70 family RNA polymerase sigma factor [Amycolatopsis sp. cg13]|uniref:sigma-70 family RNA polymerase sigma factor n=1 Tax=Amycolatopsis sp. cg13 TaxID=3238807 RepID=UPI003524231A
MPATRAARTAPPARENFPLTPEDLIVLAARGDQRAFAQLYECLSGPVYGMATAILRSPAQSEEVAQEVLLEIWRHAARFDPSRTTRVLTWALTIAHRRAIDRVRSEQAFRNRQDKAARLEFRRPYDDAGEAALSTIDRDRVRAALRGLTALQRESIQLTYFHGLTCREAADRLGVAVSTVKTRVHDGMIRLRRALGAPA